MQPRGEPLPQPLLVALNSTKSPIFEHGCLQASPVSEQPRTTGLKSFPGCRAGGRGAFRCGSSSCIVGVLASLSLEPNLRPGMVHSRRCLPYQLLGVWFRAVWVFLPTPGQILCFFLQEATSSAGSFRRQGLPESTSGFFCGVEMRTAEWYIRPCPDPFIRTVVKDAHIRRVEDIGYA